jgi:hypothetical protein
MTHSGLFAVEFDLNQTLQCKKSNARNLDKRPYLLKKYTVCRGRIHFFGLKIRQRYRRFIPKPQILQRSHPVILIEHRGMVLAIPLTQAAVGPFRSV